MSRAVIYETFGGPEVLELREVPEPHAGPGEIRVRVTAAGLNPMDWGIASLPEAAEQFGITVPSGFGYDFAGVVDEVAGGATGFAVGDRVYGGALGRAAADFVVMRTPTEAPDALWHTPDGISDEAASTLPVAGMTAAAAVAAIDPRPGDTVLVGGAAGGVGVFAVQLAKLTGARVIGTASRHVRVPTPVRYRPRGIRPRTGGPGTDIGARWRDRSDGPVRHRNGRDCASARCTARADLHNRRAGQPARRRARDRRDRREPGRHETNH